MVLFLYENLLRLFSALPILFKFAYISLLALMKFDVDILGAMRFAFGLSYCAAGMTFGS